MVGLDFEEFVLPIFVPKTQHIFLSQIPKLETISTASQHINVQQEFIRRYMKVIFEQGLMQMFLEQRLNEPDFEETAEQMARSVEKVFKQIIPFLQEFQK